jgi:hypothetical protein
VRTCCRDGRVQVSAFGKFATRHEPFVEIAESDDPVPWDESGGEYVEHPAARGKWETGVRRIGRRRPPTRAAGHDDVVDNSCRALDPRAVDAPCGSSAVVDECAEIDYAKLPGTLFIVAAPTAVVIASAPTTTTDQVVLADPATRTVAAAVSPGGGGGWATALAAAGTASAVGTASEGSSPTRRPQRGTVSLINARARARRMLPTGRPCNRFLCAAKPNRHKSATAGSCRVQGSPSASTCSQVPAALT